MHAASRHGRLALALVAVTALAAPAEAQRAAGPFAGVLGAASDPDAAHTLAITGSLFGAWDDTLSTSDSTAVDQRFLRSGGAVGASASLVHARHSPRLDWQSDANTSTRVYGTQNDAAAATFSGTTGVTTALGRRVSLSGSGALRYSPYYHFAPGLSGQSSDGAFGGGFGVATAAERNIETSAGAGLSFQLSRRDTLEFNGSASRSHFLDQDDSAIDSWGGGARFNHQLTTSLGFHAGYTRSEATYGFAGQGPATTDNFDVGVDYGDTLTLVFARRTSLSFGVSTSAVRWDDDTHFRLNGTATLAHVFGRTGTATLSYDRGTDFNVGFRDPVLRDTVSGAVNNQVGRRTTWSLQAGYVRGGIGFGSTSGRYNSVNAGGGLTVAMTRHLGVFTDYSVYHYEVPAGATVFSALSKFSRQSVTAGLTLWVPLVSQTRSTK